MRGLSILICYIFIRTVVIGSIDTKLRYYETLRNVDFTVRKKRSLDDSQSDVHVKFNTLGRHFDVLLKHDSSIFAENFKAQILKKDGSASPLFINKNDFYSGHLAENASNTVKAHVEDGVWNMVIHTEDDLYAIEPSWRHLSKSDDRSMIAYRHSDITWDHSFPMLANNSKRQKVCKSIHLDPTVDGGIIETDDNNTEYSNQDHQRWRRQAWLLKKNTCNLIVVADYRFHQTIGGGFPHRTANYLISLMNKIDNIYRDTMWSSKTGLKGFGFQIQDLRIHEAETVGKVHYNNPIDWKTRDLLQVFSRDMYFSRFCLAHLFTHQAFEGGILGLAYIASPRLGTIGGVCSSTYRKNRIRHTLNTGFSSSMNSGGNRLLTLESTLVTAHGHNWGSEHDVDNDECAPSSFHNGKYLMYPYAVNGFEENNLLFSPCSRRYVGAVIQAKAYRCFSAKVENIPLCGNGRIDKGEHCDGGEQARNGLDPCCTAKCKFRQGATCSSMNYECCENCQMASRGFPCRGDFKYSCVKPAVCSGTSLDCPKPEPKRDTTPCLEGGQCFGGQCLSYCEVRDRKLVSCQCEGDAKRACRRCCRSRTPGSKCQPQGTAIQMKGRPCYLGFCSEHGECIKPKSKLVERLFDVIEKLTSSQLVEFMRSNIVGTVIIFSMAIWIPASWAFSCVDKHRQKIERENLRWKSRESQELFSSLDAASWNIKPSRRIRLNRPGIAAPRRQLSQSNPSLTPSTHETAV